MHPAPRQLPLQLCAAGHPHLQLVVFLQYFAQNKLTEKSIFTLNLPRSSGSE